MPSQGYTGKLLEPFSMRGLILKNRVLMAPMTRSRAGKERRANALMAEYYAQRASAGLLITEATVISKQGIGWLNSPGVYTDEQAESWRLVAEAVHAHGTPIFLQLWHWGRASHSSFQENGALPVAPSPVKLNGDFIRTPMGKQPYETHRALEPEEIPLMVEDYRKAAERAKAAGHADLISFGRPYLSNPDLVAPFANGWPFNPEPDVSVWYAFGAAGYTDFPRYQES